MPSATTSASPSPWLFAHWEGDLRLCLSVLSAAALLALPSTLHAQGELGDFGSASLVDQGLVDPPASGACDGQGRTGWMLRETILGVTNTLAGVVSTRVGYCRPLVRSDSILFMLSEVEAGFYNFTTPSFTRQGAYVRLVPLSFLVFNVSVVGVYYWPLPEFRVAAYWDAGSYDLTWPSDGITNDITVEKEQGGGLNVTASVTLRAAITIGRLSAGPVELIVLDNLSMDYWYFPGHDFYYNQRMDSVLARSEVGLSNTAALLVGVPLTHQVGLRFGATDSLGYVATAGHLATHQVGGLVMVPIQTSAARLAELAPFLRVTTYTHHRTRDLSFAWNFLVGVDLAVRL